MYQSQDERILMERTLMNIIYKMLDKYKEYFVYFL